MDVQHGNHMSFDRPYERFEVVRILCKQNDIYVTLHRYECHMTVEPH